MVKISHPPNWVSDRRDKPRATSHVDSNLYPTTLMGGYKWHVMGPETFFAISLVFEKLTSTSNSLPRYAGWWH